MAELEIMSGSVAIHSICSKGNVIVPVLPVEQVHEMFRKGMEAWGFTVVEDTKAIGIVTKEKLSFCLSGRYGYSLYQKKPIRDVMETDFLQVDYLSSIHQVAKMAMERKPDCLYDMIVISREGRYFGYVTVKDLLLKSMEISVNTAKYENPLTGLPGNVLINQELKRVVESKKNSIVIYVDLDNFKAFNDVYGFENGDRIICYLAQALKKYQGKKDFVGHIGGDDFVLVTRNEDYKEQCQEMLSCFHAKADKLYREEDRKKGYIECMNRQGKWERFGLVSVTLAATKANREKYRDIEEMTEELAAIKKQGKKTPGDVITDFT